MPIAAKIVAESIEKKYFNKKPEVVDMGNQTYAIDQRTMYYISQLLDGSTASKQYGCDIKQLNSFVNSKPAQYPGAPGVPLVEDFYKALGFAAYDAIDVNSRFDNLVMDLNESLNEVHNFKKQYDLVTNLGVSEHLFNQAVFFENAHNLAKKGALMLHVLPLTGYINHGFFNYQPRLFEDLCLANNYELLRLGVTDSDSILLDLLEQTEKATFFYHYTHILSKGAYDNTYIIALMRKGGNGPFIFPIQGKYKKDIDVSNIRDRYKLQEDDIYEIPTKGFFTPQKTTGFGAFLKKSRRYLKLRLLGLLQSIQRFILNYL